MPLRPNVGDLFFPEPPRWGLRGDPFLWRAMKKRLASWRMPTTFSGLISRIESAYLAETGRKLEMGPYFYLDKFAHGGMSSGGIAPDFWMGKGIPLLLQRFSELSLKLATAHPEHSEKDLDREIEFAFKSDANFVRWFLSKCGTSDHWAAYAWSRSDHPWTSVDLEIRDHSTGEVGTVRREGETDILVVVTLSTGQRLGLHIENKRGGGRFTKYQPEMYAARALKWKRNPKYGNYDEAITVLIAPKVFLANYALEAQKFDFSVFHEELAARLPAFGANET